MITDADIIKLSKVFATKEDLNRFVIKEDLHEIRDDIKNIHRDVELLRHTTKTDLSNAVKEIIEFIADNNSAFEARFNDHEQRIKVLENETLPH